MFIFSQESWDFYGRKVLLLVLEANGGCHLGKHTWCEASLSQRRVKNKGDTGGLDLKTSFPCQSVRVEGCQSGLGIQGLCRCCFKGFFSADVLGAACIATGSSEVDHCRRCLLSVTETPLGDGLQSRQADSRCNSKTCHIYFML